MGTFFHLDVSVYMVKRLFCRHILLENEFKKGAHTAMWAVSPMSGNLTADTKKNRNRAN